MKPQISITAEMRLSRQKPQLEVGTAVSRWPLSTWKAQAEIPFSEAWTDKHLDTHARLQWLKKNT